MPKGKKFDAAEKHFMKKEEALRREIKELRDALTSSRQALENSLARQNQLVVENATLKQERDRSLQLQGLTQEEIRQLIKDEHDRAESARMFKSMVGLSSHLSHYA